MLDYKKIWNKLKIEILQREVMATINDDAYNPEGFDEGVSHAYNKVLKIMDEFEGEGEIDLEIARQNVLILKGSFICENCKHIVKSEVTNKLFCSYHSEGEYQYETYKGDYCSYFDRME